MIAADLRESDRLLKRSVAGRGLFEGEARTDCELKKWWLAFQRDAARISIPLRVVWGWRSWEQQAELHAKGVGTRPGNSAHNFGMALDVIHMRRAWEQMPKQGWQLLGAMGKEVARKQGLQITWGGDFKSRYDPAHWELTDWHKRTASPCDCVGGCLPMDDLAIPAVPPERPEPHQDDVQSFLEGLKKRFSLGSRCPVCGLYTPK